jgi:NTE family protein
MSALAGFRKNAVRASVALTLVLLVLAFVEGRRCLAQGLRTPTGPPKGTVLCLSGGGYRAMLFHLGVIWRLNEVGLLSKLDAISSVSGGSIVAGVLAHHWRDLDFDDQGRAQRLDAVVVAPVRQLADTTLDLRVIFWGLVTPWSSIGDQVAATYQERLFGRATLQDLPDTPRFYFNATNLQTGLDWEFSKEKMGDYKLGWVRNPTTDLATVIAASAAFPPFLSPVHLPLHASDFQSGSEFQMNSGEDLDTAAFREHVLLTDGGVYDNLGLSVASRYKQVLVSNAGGRLQPTAKPGADWLRQMLSVINILYDQPANERTKALTKEFADASRDGAYWSSLNCGLVPLPTPAALLPMDCHVVDALARIPTRLRRLDARTQERLINAGYALSDRMLRAYVVPDAPLPKYPYQRGLGEASEP